MRLPPLFIGALVTAVSACVGAPTVTEVEHSTETPVAALPGFWAPLFVQGRTSTWDVRVETKTMDIDHDLATAPPAPTMAYATKIVTCTVDAVDQAPTGVRQATVSCSGLDAGGEISPAGTWFTDGAQVWQPGSDGMPDAPTLSNPPKTAHRQLGEGEDVEIIYAIEAGPSPGLWCHSERFLMGDGGVFEVCFDKDRGPYSFTTLSGSAAQDITTVITLR
jgi:hypothetical protein